MPTSWNNSPGASGAGTICKTSPTSRYGCTVIRPTTTATRSASYFARGMVRASPWPWSRPDRRRRMSAIARRSGLRKRSRQPGTEAIWSRPGPQQQPWEFRQGRWGPGGSYLTAYGLCPSRGQAGAPSSRISERTAGATSATWHARSCRSDLIRTRIPRR